MLVKLVVTIFVHASFIAAQFPNSPYSIDPGTVDSNTRDSWCAEQQNTCITLCSSFTQSNTCNTATLQYVCTCTSNNSSPGLLYYIKTVPTNICEQNWVDCTDNAGNNQTANTQCADLKATYCGQLDPANFRSQFEQASGASSSSSSSSSANLPSFGSATATQSSSKSTSTSPTSTATGTLSGSTSTSKNPTSQPTSPGTSVSSFPQSSQSAKSSDLSTGAEIGIAIGVFILVLVTFLLVWVGLSLRKILRQRAAAPMNNLPDIAELSTNDRKRFPWGVATELAGTKLWPFGTRAPVEMDGTSNVSRPWRFGNRNARPPVELDDGARRPEMQA